MEPSVVAESIPFTAWQQAVFVVLFLVFVAYVLYWQSRQSDKAQKFQDEQNRSWQKFIQEQDEKWRQWLKEANTTQADAMKGVTEALEKLGDKLDAHDEKVDDRIAAVGRQRGRTGK